jgi:hypothetical protein
MAEKGLARVGGPLVPLVGATMPLSYFPEWPGRYLFARGARVAMIASAQTRAK